MTMPPLLASMGAVTVTGNASQDPEKLEQFRAMALDLMTEHGLNSWNFRLDRARVRAGQCCYSSKTLTFSAALMSLWTEEQQRETVLHEIAHALTPGHHHDRIWQLKCLDIGADPARTWGHNGEESLEPRWTATCPNGHEMYRDRKPSKLFSCALCSREFDERYLFTWKRNF